MTECSTLNTIQSTVSVIISLFIPVTSRASIIAKVLVHTFILSVKLYRELLVFVGYGLLLQTIQTDRKKITVR